MTLQILTTKLHIPRSRPRRVTRRRLFARLNQGLDGKLTLISAPPGFGKTALVVDWLETLDRPAAWLTLESADNDRIRFFVYLGAALQKIDQSLGESFREAMNAPGFATVEALLIDLIRQITDKDITFVLVLDDYHEITDPSIHQIIAFALEHQPQGMHLVLITRRNPPLSLARLRVQGQMNEIRAADLRFSQQEAGAFFNDVMGFGLAPDLVAQLEARTEGWIAGMHMAALALPDDADSRTDFVESFAGNDRYVMDYLVEEVLLRQSDEVQNFLMRTAILKRLSGPLCDAVAFDGERRSQEILEFLEEANLFVVPMDTQRRVYRYHPLFADLLRHRLRRWPRDEVRALHRRASAWYESEENIIEAVEHALAAEDTGRVVRLFEENTLAMMEYIPLSRLKAWFESLPPDIIDAHPWLCIFYAWTLVYTGPLEPVERLLDRACASETNPPSNQLKGYAAAIRAYLAHHHERYDVMNVHAKRALDWIPAHDKVARSFAMFMMGCSLSDGGAVENTLHEAIAISHSSGKDHVGVLASCSLADYQKTVWGQLHRAAETYGDAIRALDRSAREGKQRIPVAGYVYTGLAQIFCEWNDLEKATFLVSKGLKLCEQWGQMDVLIIGLVRRAEIFVAEGNFKGADAMMEKAAQSARGFATASTRWVAFSKARLRLRMGDITDAVRWVRQMNLSADDDIKGTNAGTYLIVARMLIMRGTHEEALDLLGRILAVTRDTDALARTIEAELLRALALQAMGEEDRALRAMVRALSLAEPQGYVRLFVREGEAAARLLYRISAHGATPSRTVSRTYVSRLLKAITKPEDDSDNGKAEALIEPLSEREREVLALIAEGLSNREIADRLILSVSTVKAHAHHIYTKLDVGNRVQAVERARAIGLLA
jgi:LuxR family maltose regulon positive regulatory protein